MNQHLSRPILLSIVVCVSVSKSIGGVVYMSGRHTLALDTYVERQSRVYRKFRKEMFLGGIR